MKNMMKLTGVAAVVVVGLAAMGMAGDKPESRTTAYDPTKVVVEAIAKMDVRPGDWPMWAGSAHRNNTPNGKNIPIDWDIDDGTNVLWSAKLGSQTYGNPVIANGQVYVGTNNQAGYLERYPSSVDLGCLLCFDEKTGDFLWQHSSEKLPTGRVHDWEMQGICCAPYAEGERVWFVSSRGKVICLDSKGYHDGENDGPFKDEPNNNKNEADVIWEFDMMGELKVSQHNMCSCSVTCLGDILFVHTSNGVDETHLNIPSPNAPSFMAMNRNTGEVYWTDKSPGLNILHGQWSSPAIAQLGGVQQVLFAGGDGWLYSFKADAGQNGKPELLWKFDCNPKLSKWELGGRGTRNNLIATPCVYDSLVYIAVGQDPEHLSGIGHLWCIDPTKRGDVSPELALKSDGTPVDHKRLQAIDPEAGEKAIKNPNSAALWHYDNFDLNGDGEIDTFSEVMHRTCGTVAIKNDILVVADFDGLVHCLNAKTGKPHWTYDMLSASWGSPLIVEGRIYVGDEDGDVTIFKLSAGVMDEEEKVRKPEIINEVIMSSSVYTTPVIANDTLFISSRTDLYAIKKKD